MTSGARGDRARLRAPLLASDPDGDFKSRLVEEAIEYATQRAEIVIVGRAQMVKADKKSFHTGVLALHMENKAIAPLLPKVPKGVQRKRYDEGLRNRAERTQPQTEAIATLTLAVLAEGGGRHLQLALAV